MHEQNKVKLHSVEHGMLAKRIGHLGTVIFHSDFFVFFITLEVEVLRHLMKSKSIIKMEEKLK